MGNNPMNILSQIMSSGNPQQMVQNMVRQNPQINALLNQQKNSGMSMEQFVRQYAKQNNIDINPYIQMMQNGKIK